MKLEEATTSKASRSQVTPGTEPRTNVEQVLKELRRGHTIIEMQEKMQEVVAAVKDTAKKGSLTLQLSIEPRTPGDPNEVVIDAIVTSKIPQKTRPKTIFFTTRNNGLQREDPRQGTLEGIIEAD